MSTAPHRLGKYEFQQLLGKGNVGEVWKARDLSTKRDVALKIVYADLQRSDSQFLTRFMTDGQVLVTLHHANLVPILEVNVTRQEQSNEVTAYLAMEYMAGQTFASYLQNTSQKGNFPPLSEIISLYTLLGSALDYTQQREIVHGDLSPSNIFLNLQDTSHFLGGEPMLADTGLGQILGPAINTHTKPPLYLSPEQAQGYPPSQRSDVYALGIILYEIYTGTVPFRRESSTAIITQHIRALPTPPALINPIVPSTLSEVILHAIAKNPTSRFPNVSALASAIAEANSVQLSPSITEQLPVEDKTTFNQPVRRENSILGVAQPPSLPGVLQFRYSNVPLLNESIIEEPRAPMPVAPTPSAPLPANPKPLVTNPLPSVAKANTPVETPKELPKSEPIRQIQQPVAQIQGAVTLPPLTNARTTNTLRTVSGPLVRQTLRPIEAGPPASPTQGISLSAISQAQRTPNAPQSTNTQYRQQERPIFNVDQSVPFTSAPQQQEPPVSPFLSPPPLRPAQPLSPPPLMPTRGNQKKSSRYIALVALLALFLIGGTLAAIFLLNRGNGNQANTGNGANRVFFLDGDSQHSNQLRIDMHNITPPPDGKTYFAWLQNTAQQSQPLGALSVQNGNASLMYQGDDKHTNLLSITQGILITTEDAGGTPKNPGDVKVYQASFNPQFLDGLKQLLYATPGLPGQQSVVATILDTLHSIDDKAGSVVDSLNHDNGLAIRQATRIIELLDTTKQARSSGDLPAKYQSQLDVPIGLLSSPSQQGYLDLLDAQLKQLDPLVANDTVVQQHLANIKNGLVDLRTWLQKMHDNDVQILKAADLRNPTTSGIALQLKQVSADSYTGHIIPPNSSPLPISGSAGALQAYSEAQYMATLYLQPA